MLATTFIGWAKAADELRVKIRRKSVDSAFLFIAYTPPRVPDNLCPVQIEFQTILADLRAFHRSRIRRMQHCCHPVRKEVE
jgi:hypothetical protein